MFVTSFLSLDHEKYMKVNKQINKKDIVAASIFQKPLNFKTIFYRGIPM